MTGADTLFRMRPVSDAGRRLLGQVCIATPPGACATLIVAILSLSMLGAAVYAVEVPQRTRAIGVLMPADGLLDVVATGTGRIAELAVAEGMRVTEGQMLLRLTSDRNAPDRSPISEYRIQSLKTELGILDQVHVSKQDLEARLASGLEEQIALTEQRLVGAEAEAALQIDHVRLLEQRFGRMRVLVESGGLAADALVQQQSGILQARATATSIERDILQVRQELGSLKSDLEQLRNARGLDGLRHEMERERLLRQIGTAEVEAGQVVLAPTTGVVARLSVTPGSVSRPGDVLMTLYKEHGRLEAWLYLPSDKAGQLEAGQTVQLRLDAYPHEMFGTVTAVVSKVSNIALLAPNLAVPLPIRGPVFEVRASISESSISALGSSWPLSPGTSFKADLIRQRFRLYQWLLRSIRGETVNGSVTAGS